MDSPNNNSMFDDQDEEEVQLPGFRFHPTDEELVGFYLRRKVDMKPLSIELIKTIDIYKYDPWDLPKASCTSGDKEWYFFSKRGRKYKNSIRPNRVTGSGFWKATGIDKPVNSHGGDNNNNNSNNDNNNPILTWNNQKNNEQCIGLKKTLVYYRGSAGKGTKTDWMMHEFRLPAIRNDNKSSPMTDSSILQEAEIWTLCRIFKRTLSYRKYTPDFRELSSKRTLPNMDTNISYKKRNCMEFNNTIEDHNYIDFTAPTIFHDHEKKPAISNNQFVVNDNENNNIGKFHHGGGLGATNQVLHVTQLSSMATHNNNYINIDNNNYNNNYVDSPCNNNSNNNNNDYSVMDYYSSLSSSLMADEIDQEFGYTSWDELRAVVEYALDPALT